MNKGFIKVSLLLAGAVALAGFVGYLVTSTKVEASAPVCYGDCPTFDFHAEHYLTQNDDHGHCPIGWTYVPGNNDYCKKLETFDLNDVQRVKSNDDNKCHKPSTAELDIPSWAAAAYGQVPEWVLPNVIQCPATPTPTATPSATPTPTPDESCPDNASRNSDKICVCDEGFHDDEEGEALVCVPDTTPTPTPTVTPTPTPEPQQPSSSGTTPAGAPQCTDHTPLVLPSNVHVVRNGADATVNFFTQSSNANIYFKEVHASNWEHAVRDIVVTGGYVSYTIHDLNPALGYTFGVQAANSCAGGETVVAVVVDGPESVTFPMNYWEWLH